MPRLQKQSLRRPPLHAAGGSVCGTPQRFFGGRCPSAVRKAGSGWWGPGTAVGGSDSGRPRSLLTDHLSYGARWEPSVLLDMVVKKSTGYSVEQLERLYSVLSQCIYKYRREYDKTQLLEEMEEGIQHFDTFL
ncbi:unnamed protein product [Pleuronectes platessa]|uniref:Uncharacterized protein n=1 Tax=Pleuronectes platessa TaxID=8262 RepID=A0A9N7VA76_PLEPL|nr:unnamed protein product [Pleuronectes platessa]